MSEPLPSPPPPDDRELDDFLAGRSELSRRYREEAAGIQAPAALDAAILEASRQAVAASIPKPRSRAVHRWRLPLSLAATLVVGIGVLREVRQDPGLLPPLDDQSAAVLAGSGAPSKRMREAGPKAEPEAGPAPSKNERAPARAVSEQRGAQPVSRKPVVDAAGAAADQASPATPVAAAPEAAAAVVMAEVGGVAEAPASASPLAAKAAPSSVAAPLPSALSRSASGWQAARYRGLLPGEASFAEVIDKLELPSSTSLPASQVLRLVTVDMPLPGEAELRFTAEGKLRQVQLTLAAPMPLTTVVAAVVAADASFTVVDRVPDHCAELARHLLDADRYPQLRLYRSEGVVLSLPEAGMVTSLDYLPGCH